MANVTTTTCAYDDLRPKLANLVEHHRIADDPVLFCCDVSAAPKTWLGYVWGDPEPYDYAHVVTAHKLITARRSKIYRSIGSVSSMDLLDVVAVEPTLTKHYGYAVTVQGEGQGVLECPMTAEARPQFISALQAAVAQAKLRPPAPPPGEPEDETAPAVAERLQRLGDLLAQGIITPGEYQQRREAILDEL